MNARILKKLSKKAVPLLVAMGYSESSFVRSGDGDTTELGNCDRKHLQIWKGAEHPKNGNCHGYVDLFRSTPLYSYQTSYEYNEWDYKPAWDVLAETSLWADIEIDENCEIISDSRRTFPSDILRWARKNFIQQHPRPSGLGEAEGRG